jgi:hypothetical protein
VLVRDGFGRLPADCVEEAAAAAAQRLPSVLAQAGAGAGAGSGAGHGRQLLDVRAVGGHFLEAVRGFGGDPTVRTAKMPMLVALEVCRQKLEMQRLRDNNNNHHNHHNHHTVGR